MGTIKAYGKEVLSIFQLMGNNENDITKSIAWVLNQCPAFLKHFIRGILGIEIDPDAVEIIYQNYDSEYGITDIEIKDNSTFHIIIEAKRGWILPGVEQLSKYSLRNSFIKNDVKHKAIVSMSECSEEYAKGNLVLSVPNGVPVIHVSWRKIYTLTEISRKDSNNTQKRLLEELQMYLKGVMTMQTKDSNWVFVVVLGKGKPQGSNLSWKDIVNKEGKYFHPVGINGWPKEPPNYIAFRYDGKLQSIHHIEDYVVTKNMHDEIGEMPDEEWEDNHFVYSLGPAIIPSKLIRTGKIYRNGRVWAMLDTLLTADTVSEARDISKKRI